MIDWMLDFILKMTTEVSVFNLSMLAIWAVCLIISFRALIKNRKITKQLFQLQNEFRAMNSGHLGMGRKIRKVSNKMAKVETNRQQPTVQPTVQSTNKENVYQQAGLLLTRGASIEEVVEFCHITAAEAELIATMRLSAPSNVHAQKSLVA